MLQFKRLSVSHISVGEKAPHAGNRSQRRPKIVCALPVKHQRGCTKIGAYVLYTSLGS